MSWKKIGMTSGFVMAATVATASLQWVIMARIARQEGAATLGLYILSLSIAVPLAYLSWLSIRQKYLILESGRENMADFLFLRTVLPAIVFGIAFLLIYILAPVPKFAALCFGLFVSKYVEGFFDLLYARMQKEGQALLVAKASIVRSIILAFAFVIIYSFSRNLIISIILTNVIQALTLLPFFPYFSVSNITREEGSRAKLVRRLHLAVELFPMSLSIFLTSFITNTPRLLLGSLISPEELGYYAAVSSFVTAGLIAALSIGQSILPGLGDAAATGAKVSFWWRILWPMALVEIGSLLGALASVFIGSTLMTSIYGKSFQHLGYMLMFGALSAGPMYMASIANNGIYAINFRAAYFWTQVSTLVFTIFGIITFAYIYGLAGVFIALGLSGLFQTLLCIVILMRHWSSNLSIHISVRRIGRSTASPISSV